MDDKSSTINISNLKKVDKLGGTSREPKSSNLDSSIPQVPQLYNEAKK